MVSLPGEARYGGLEGIDSWSPVKQKLVEKQQ
jgi:hypothetical protein